MIPAATRKVVFFRRRRLAYQYIALHLSTAYAATCQPMRYELGFSSGAAGGPRWLMDCD
jgi:hypothetical protein